MYIVPLDFPNTLVFQFSYCTGPESEVYIKRCYLAIIIAYRANSDPTGLGLVAGPAGGMLPIPDQHLVGRLRIETERDNDCH